MGLLGEYEGGASKEKVRTVETVGEIKRARFYRLRGGKKATELAAAEAAKAAKAADAAAVAASRAQVVLDVQQANQRADVWAFGCLLASLALHEKLTRQQSPLGRRLPKGDENASTRGESWARAGELERGRRRGERRDPSLHVRETKRPALVRRSGANMDGWDYDEKVSKDRPGRCAERQLSKRKLSAVRAAGAGDVRASPVDRRARRTSCVQRKFEALAERRKQAEADVLRSTAEALTERREQKPSSLSRGGGPLNAPPPLDDSSHGSASIRHGSTCADMLRGIRRTSLRPKIDSVPEAVTGAAEAEVKDAAEVEVWPDELLCGMGRKANITTLRDSLAHEVVPANGETLVKEQKEDVTRRQPGLTPTTEDKRSVNSGQTNSGAPGACNRACKSAAGGTFRAGVKVQQSRLLYGRGAARCLPTQCQASNRRDDYLMMLRVCQGKVSPLDGVTLACCPKPLLQLATQCCTLDPEVRLHVTKHAHSFRENTRSCMCTWQARPTLSAVLEQLQDKALFAVDPSSSIVKELSCRRIQLTAAAPWTPGGKPLSLGCSLHSGGAPSPLPVTTYSAVAMHTAPNDAARSFRVLRHPGRSSTHDGRSLCSLGGATPPSGRCSARPTSKKEMNGLPIYHLSLTSKRTPSVCAFTKRATSCGTMTGIPTTRCDANALRVHT